VINVDNEARPESILWEKQA